MSAMNVDSATGHGALPADDILPIAILMDELKAEDIAVRLLAVRRLSTIALALGPDRARNELIPFLEDSTDDEDEVLAAIAEELGCFVDVVGGPAYAHLLLPTLEALAAAEETVVRDAAIAAIGKVAAVLSPVQIDETLVPLIKRLSTGDWFTSKVSAAGLYAFAYASARPEIQDELRKFFANLARDDAPMVRRAAATNMPAFVRTIGNAEHVKAELFPIFVEFAADDQDSVRLLAVPIFLALAAAVDIEVARTQLVPTLLSLLSDRSWRVRYNAATHYLELTQAISGAIATTTTATTAAAATTAGAGDPDAMDATPTIQAPAAAIDPDLVHSYVALLRDVEAEVRQAAATQLPGMAAAMNDPAQVLSMLVPCVKDLVTDANQYVRAAVAQQVSGLAPILGKEATTEYLLAMFLQLLKDEFSDVRLNLISRLEHINPVIGIDLLAQSLLPAIMELAEDKQWRVRAAIIEYMPLLAQQLGMPFFNDRLGALCMSWLSDPVFAIREAACENLKNLSKVFGKEWTRDSLLPQLTAKVADMNYLARMTTILALQTLAPTLPDDLLRSPVLPAIATLAEDKIPNIRFNVAKAIEALVPTLRSHGLQDAVLPALKKMVADTDADVRFFGAKALAAIEGTGAGTGPSA